MLYIKEKYNNPIIRKNDLNKINSKRTIQAGSEKIIVAGMSTRIEAIYDNGEILGGKSTTIILGKKLKFLLGILNSTLVSFALNIIYNSLKMSGGYLNIGTRELENIPIPAATDDEQTPIIAKVDEILSDPKSKRAKDLEDEIDKLVYKLYGLSPEEINVVEGGE